MEKRRIRYFPIIELAIFALSLIPIWLVPVINSGFWLPFLLTIFSYLIFVSTSSYINIKEDVLTIAFFNPFQSKHLVDISKIKKITSNQTFEFESDFSMENTYSVLRDSYNLEYTDKNEMIRVVRFKLLRRKNATAIINMLTKKPQKNRNIDFHL